MKTESHVKAPPYKTIRNPLFEWQLLMMLNTMLSLSSFVTNPLLSIRNTVLEKLKNAGFPCGVGGETLTEGSDSGFPLQSQLMNGTGSKHI